MQTAAEACNVSLILPQVTTEHIPGNLQRKDYKEYLAPFTDIYKGIYDKTITNFIMAVNEK
jgi:hypothetical protein